MTRPPCRCLLAEMPDETELADIIAARIGEIAEEERTPGEEYRRRLALCRDCESLNRGTCARCGCYVEIRAARKRMGCPCVPARWESMK